MRSGESKTFSILSGRSWDHIPLCLPIEKTPSDSLLASWQYQSHPGFLLEGTIRTGRWRQSHANRGSAHARFFFVLLRSSSLWKHKRNAGAPLSLSDIFLRFHFWLQNTFPTCHMQVVGQVGAFQCNFVCCFIHSLHPHESHTTSSVICTLISSTSGSASGFPLFTVSNAAWESLKLPLILV